MSHWLLAMLDAAPKVPPDGAPCIFGCKKDAAIALFELDEGCLCFPDDKRQHLCFQHAIRSTPFGSFEIVHAYGSVN